MQILLILNNNSKIKLRSLYVYKNRGGGAVENVIKAGTSNQLLYNDKEVVLKENFLNLVYPVGSIYWSSNNTNPATLFGGTWQQIKDRFVLAAGDSYTNGATGGAATVTLTVSNMPSHSHSFTPSGTVGSHTHNFTPSGNVSSHSHGLNSHTHSFSHTHDYSGDGTTGVMSDNAKGDVWNNDTADGIFNGSQMASSGNIKLSGSVNWAGGNVKYTNQQNHLTIDVSHTHKFSWSGTTTTQSTSTTGSASGDTTSTAPSFTGTAGNTGETAPSFSGTAGTTSSSGSGSSFSILPPYIVKYCWERTA